MRHYEEGFWLLVLAMLNILPGGKQLAAWAGLLRFAEMRAASVAMCGNFRAHDVALSLLRMISNNIGQIGTSTRVLCHNSPRHNTSWRRRVPIGPCNLPAPLTAPPR